MPELSYARGVLDGVEIALYLHRRHFDRIPPDLKDVRRALARFRLEADTVLSAMQQHKLDTVAGYFGYQDWWERVRTIRALVPLPVDVTTTSEDYRQE